MLREGQGSGVPGGGKHRLRSLIESSGDRKNDGLVTLLPSLALLKTQSREPVRKANSRRATTKSVKPPQVPELSYPLPLPLKVCINKGCSYRSRCVSAFFFFFRGRRVREAVRTRYFAKRILQILPWTSGFCRSAGDIAQNGRSLADLAFTCGWLRCAEPSTWRPWLRGRAAPWVGMDTVGGQAGF